MRCSDSEPEPLSHHALAEAAHELRSAMHHLLRVMSVEEADGDPGSQLTPSQSSLLKRVRSAGPSTPADLARAEWARPQSALATLKPLVEASLVERYPHPTDGRQILIVLSERGRDLLAERDTTRSDVPAVMIAERLNPAEQRTVAEAATLLRRLGDH